MGYLFCITCFTYILKYMPVKIIFTLRNLVRNTNITNSNDRYKKRFIGYFFCITCPTYILKYMPKVKSIFTLRNPVRNTNITNCKERYIKEIKRVPLLYYLPNLYPQIHVQSQDCLHAAQSRADY